MAPETHCPAPGSPAPRSAPAGTCGGAESGGGAESETPRRVLVLTNIPSPYQVDYFTALAERPEVDPFVVFCSASEHDRQFSTNDRYPFPSTVLASRRPRGMPKDWHVNDGLRDVLASRLPLDLAVVSGSYFMPSARAARGFFTRRGVPWLFWGEDPLKKQSGALRSLVRRRYLRWFLAPAAGAMGVGRRACRSYRGLLPAGRVAVDFPYAPDLSGLTAPSAAVREQAARLTADWGAAAPVVVLFAGALSERKAPDVLLEAFALASQSEPRLRLQVAGDGPLRESLVRRAEALGVSYRVRLLGFVEDDALRAAYLSSHVLVLPTRSHEGWGVVVQEALAAGLPVIASERVGAAADLVSEGSTGWITPPGDATVLADRLVTAARTLSEPDEAAAWCGRCRAAVEDQDCRARARQFVELLQSPALRSALA